MRRILWMVTLLTALAGPATAGPGRWTPVGGPFTPSAHVLVDPAHPATLYALVHQSGASYQTLWKSTDAAASWFSIQEGIGAPPDLLALDPRDPARLYAFVTADTSYKRLWASEDGGASWELRFEPPANSIEPAFTRLVPSPLASGVLYGLERGFGHEEDHSVVYRSTDAGATWEKRGVVGTRFSQELFHDVARDLLYYFDDRALYSSADGGQSWAVRGRFRGEGFFSVVQAPTAPETLYGVPGTGLPASHFQYACLVRSDDRGATWRPAGPAPRTIGQFPTCSSVVVDPHDAGLVRVTVGSTLRGQIRYTLHTSRDGGRTWSAGRALPSVGGVPATTVVPSPDDPDVLYADSQGFGRPGPFKSTDGGQTFHPAWDGIVSGDLRAGLVALPAPGPTRLPRLFAVLESSLLVRSDNGGATWATEPLEEVLAVAADADAARVYALAGGRVFRGAAAGGTWVAASPPSVVSTLLADPFEPGRLFAGSFEDDNRLRLWRSTDGGQSWAVRNRGLLRSCVHFASIDFCPRLLALTSDPRDPGLVLLSYKFFDRDVFLHQAIYRSTDGGRSWAAARQSPPGEVLALAADPEQEGAFLAGSGASLYRSVDGGDHWEPFGTGLPEGSIVRQLLRDGRSGAWYAATDVFGIFRSADGGRTWTAIDAGLPDRDLPLIVLDPGVRDRLFAALRALGIWTWRRPGPG